MTKLEGVLRDYGLEGTREAAFFAKIPQTRALAMLGSAAIIAADKEIDFNTALHRVFLQNRRSRLVTQDSNARADIADFFAIQPGTIRDTADPVAAEVSRIDAINKMPWSHLTLTPASNQLQVADHRDVFCYIAKGRKPPCERKNRKKDTELYSLLTTSSNVDLPDDGYRAAAYIRHLQSYTDNQLRMHQLVIGTYLRKHIALHMSLTTAQYKAAQRALCNTLGLKLTEYAEGMARLHDTYMRGRAAI